MRMKSGVILSRDRLQRLAPVAFVFLWATGFIGAKLGLPYAEPFTFLALRMGITFAVLLPIVMVFVNTRASAADIAHSMVTGILLHGCYLGAVFWVIANGMPAGVAALVVALQPLITVFIAKALLGEAITSRQILVFLIALFGVALVLVPRINLADTSSGITPFTVGWVMFSVVAISFGTVYQKRFVKSIDLRIGAAAQYAGAALFLLVLSSAFETGHIEWSGAFIFALAWLVIVLSLGAVTLLMALIKANSSAKTASLFYLVPVVTALIAWPLFGETLNVVQIAGMVIVVLAVARA